MSYVETFMKEKPKAGMEIMSNRVKKSKQMDEELSDFFRERAQIEETYSRQLLKLAKKTYITEKGMFNHLDSILVRLQKEVEDIAANHQNLAQSITKKVDKIVRESTNIHMDASSIRLIESNSQRLTKEYEDKSAKIAKLQKSVKSKTKKNETTNEKIVDLSKALEEIRISLDSEIKRFYEQHERVDQSRLETLKKALINYENYQIEGFEKNLKMSQNILESIGSLDTKEQLLDFASGYRELNLTSNNTNGIKLPSKIDSSFGSWILRPRKNSTINISNAFVNPNETPKEAHETISLSGSEVYSQKSNQVDEEGYSIPPHEVKQIISNEKEKESEEEKSEVDSVEIPQQKVKFDIRDQVIEEDPNDAAKAISYISNSLKMPIPKRSGRARRDRKTKDISAIFENNDRPLSEFNPKELQDKFRANQSLRPISEFATFRNNDDEEEEELIEWHAKEIVNAIIIPNGISKVQVIGEIIIKVSQECDESTIINDNIKLSVDDQLQLNLFHNDSILEKGETGYKVIPSVLNQIKGKQVTLFKYYIDQDNYNTLPFFIQNVLYSQLEDKTNIHKFAFNCKPRPLINKVNYIRLGTQLNIACKVKAIPEPNWYLKSREMIWESNDHSLLKVVAQFEGQINEPMFSLEFDVMCSSPVLPINLKLGKEINLVTTIKTGTVLIANNMNFDSCEILGEKSVYSTACDISFNKEKEQVDTDGAIPEGKVEVKGDITEEETANPFEQVKDEQQTHSSENEVKVITEENINGASPTPNENEQVEPGSEKLSLKEILSDNEVDEIVESQQNGKEKENVNGIEVHHEVSKDSKEDDVKI